MQKRPWKPNPPRRALSAGECRRGMAMSGGFFLFSVAMLMDGPRGGSLAWMWPFLAVLHGSLFALWANNYRRLRRGETVLVADNGARAVPRRVVISFAALLRVAAILVTTASLWLALAGGPVSPLLWLLLGIFNVTAWGMAYVVGKSVTDSDAAEEAATATLQSAPTSAHSPRAPSDPKRWWTADATREEIQQGNRR